MSTFVIQYADQDAARDEAGNLVWTDEDDTSEPVTDVETAKCCFAHYVCAAGIGTDHARLTARLVDASTGAVIMADHELLQHS